MDKIKNDRSKYQRRASRAARKPLASDGKSGGPTVRSRQDRLTGPIDDALYVTFGAKRSGGER